MNLMDRLSALWMRLTEFTSDDRRSFLRLMQAQLEANMSYSAMFTSLVTHGHSAAHTQTVGNGAHPPGDSPGTSPRNGRAADCGPPATRCC